MMSESFSIILHPGYYCTMRIENIIIVFIQDVGRKFQNDNILMIIYVYVGIFSLPRYIYG